jgi:hypothetical protein
MSIEKPDYTVVYRDGDVEYRQYEPYLISETTVRNAEGYQDAGNEGFRRLFRYITGANQRQQKIAMTAPVAQTLSEQSPREQSPGEKIAMTAPVQQTATQAGWSIAFMLPSKYTLETAPVPADERVSIREVPGSLVAVIRYSGRWTESNFSEERVTLMAVLAEENVTALSEAQSALYNAPYTLPFMRRNEVMVSVDRLPANAAFEQERRLAAY